MEHQNAEEPSVPGSVAFLEDLQLPYSSPETRYGRIAQANTTKDQIGQALAVLKGSLELYISEDPSLLAHPLLQAMERSIDRIDHTLVSLTRRAKGGGIDHDGCGHIVADDDSHAFHRRSRLKRKSA